MQQICIPNGVPNRGLWERLLEAERHVDRIAKQPISLAVLQEAIEAVARVKGVTVTLSVNTRTSALQVVKKDGPHRTPYEIEIKDGAFKVQSMHPGDMHTIVSTLSKRQHGTSPLAMQAYRAFICERGGSWRERGRSPVVTASSLLGTWLASLTTINE